MVKKITCILLALSILLCFGSGVFAAELYTLDTGEVDVNMPDVSIMVYPSLPSGETADGFELSETEISASLGNYILSLRSAERQSESEEGMAYFWLTDVSTSVPYSEFEAFKSALKKALAEKKGTDKIIFITFGEKVSVVLNGDETLEEAEALIDGVVCNHEESRIYEALSKAMDIALSNTSLPELKHIFLFSDAYDYTQSSAVNEGEINEKLKALCIPVTTFVCSNASYSGREAFGEFSRATFGRTYSVDGWNAESKIMQELAYIKGGLRLKFKAPTNKVSSAPQTLSVTLTYGGNSYTGTRDVAVKRFKEDTEAPFIEKAEVISDDTLKVYLSENVQNADKAASYSVKSFLAGKQAILSVEYNSAELSATLHMKDKLYNGKYKVFLLSADSSTEANAPSKEGCEFVQTGNKRSFGSFLKLVWWVPLVFAAVCITAAAVVSGVKKNKEEKAVWHETEEAAPGKLIDPGKAHVVDALPVTLMVVSKRDVSRNVAAAVDSSYIIGRSKAECDLSIEDESISRQHCALIFDGIHLMISDLQSVNGTYLNGVKIGEMRILADGDRLDIGSTKIIVKFKI